MVGSMGSFEPMDFWKLLNLTLYYLPKKEIKLLTCLDVWNFEPID